MSKPLVSIVTPSYNQAQYLEKTILSVINQGYPNLEYIIIDGGSCDGSVGIIKDYEDQISDWVSENDQGQTEAINKGFEIASGDIFAWINSDDTYQPGAIAEAVQFLVNNPDVGMVYGDVEIINENDETVGQFNAKQTSYQRLRRGSVNIPQPATFWRADLWSRVGPLDRSLYFAMDYDLWVKFAKITNIVYLEGHFWANFRIHEKSKTIISDDRCWDEMLQIHFRDGGSWISVLAIKYWIRKIVSPLWNWWRHKRLLK